MRWILAAATTLLGRSSHPAHALCGLSKAAGYTPAFGKTIGGYLEDSKKVPGFAGRTRDQVLLLKGNPGVRSKETFIHSQSSKCLFVCQKRERHEIVCR